MRYSRDDAGFNQVATLDIETTHYNPTQGEIVSVGLGVHERGTPADSATYELLHRDGDDEADLITRAFTHLDELDADGLVSYKGRTFDLDFLLKRLEIQGASAERPKLATPDTHVDLFEDRAAEADRQRNQYPSLEECLDSYNIDPAETVWGGSELTNTRFGEELGPTYLAALDDGDDDRCANLVDVIKHYLVTDLEANIALYYSDIGETFEPVHLGSKKTFEA